jgi:hypothetical protein
MSVINKQLPEDLQYIGDARGLYGECVQGGRRSESVIVDYRNRR